MRNAIGVFILLSVATIPLTPRAVAQTAPQYEHLKGLDPFIGVWEGKYDPPGEPPMGTVRVECKWIGSKSYFQFEATYSPDGVEVEGQKIVLKPNNIFIGYSGKTKSPYSWHLAMGSHMDGPAEIQKNKIVMNKLERYGDSGSKGSRSLTFELRGDELVGGSTNIIRNGEKQPDEEPLVLKRVTDSARQE